MALLDTATSPVLKMETPGELPGTQPTTASKVAERSKEAAQEIVFGSLAGVLGKFLEYPFDTVKVRLQSQADTVPLKYKGPMDCFSQSFKEEGMRGLYRGISAPLVGAAVETSSLFFSVSSCRDPNMIRG
jgi:ornithine carrier protein